MNNTCSLWNSGDAEVCICSWNKSVGGSTALWKIYSDFGKGIMLKSSVKKIIDSFRASPEVIRLSDVRY